MTSGTTFPSRFTRVDELALPDHYFLSEDDVCYYLGEYTARKRYSYSATNQLISNFKKRMNLRGTAQWRYKGEAIRQVASTFRGALTESALKGLTFVPVPPSEARDDPMHDDRLTQMLGAIDPSLSLDIREIVVQSVSTPKSHQSENRLRPDELVELYNLDEPLTEPVPRNIAVVDDLLTAGSHFRAMKEVLALRFPSAHIMGLFIARRVPNTDDPEEFDE